MDPESFVLFLPGFVGQHISRACTRINVNLSEELATITSNCVPGRRRDIAIAYTKYIHTLQLSWPWSLKPLLLSRTKGGIGLNNISYPFKPIWYPKPMVIWYKGVTSIKHTSLIPEFMGTTRANSDFIGVVFMRLIPARRYSRHLPAACRELQRVVVTLEAEAKCLLKQTTYRMAANPHRYSRHISPGYVWPRPSIL